MDTKKLEQLEELKKRISSVDKTKVGWKKYIKKLRIQVNNLTSKAFELDPKKYAINKKCKHCKGRGYLGYVKNEPIICVCVKVTKEYKEHLKIELDKVHKEKEKPVKRGFFKGFKKIKDEDIKEKEEADKIIDNIPTV